MEHGDAHTLLTIFRDTLRVRDIDVDSRFYALGGDSLVAIRVVTEARANGLPITLRDLLVHQSVRGILGAPEVVAGLAGTRRAPVERGAFALLAPEDRARVPAGVVDAVPASALQSGMLYLAETSGDPLLYRSTTGWEVCEPFDPDRFTSAWRALVRRHPALRSAFDFGDLSVPAQLVWAEAEVPVVVTSAPGPEGAERAVARWLEEVDLDWRRPPLVRCRVVALPASFRVALVAHHAILDGWSVTRLSSELLRHYAGPDPRLPELDLGPARALLAAERAAEADSAAAAHWLAAADVPPLLPPPPGPVPDVRAAVQVELDADLVGALTRVARVLGVAVKSVALAAHVRALATWTGREHDVVTGVVFNTRPPGPDADQAMGLFLNTLPVRFASVADTWAGLVATAGAAEQTGVAHQEYPQAGLVAKLGRAPFDVAFNFMDFHAYQEGTAVPTRSWWRRGKSSMGFTVSVEITGAVGQVRVAYDPDHLPGTAVAEFAELVTRALRAIAANPVTPAR